MEVSTIRKYDKFKTASLKNTAIRVFNEFIRLRDKGERCISCGAFTRLQAGHFYPAGNHNNLRFNEDNVHGQCLSCNYFKSANLHKYRPNLIKKIGEDRVHTLDLLALVDSTPDDRLALIQIIEKYRPIVNKLKRMG